MVLLEEYYEFNENENISKWWKLSQIFAYICAAFFGIWCGFTLAVTKLAFEDKCFLSAKVILADDQSRAKSGLSFDNTNSVWGSDSLCEYCQYSMVSSFIFATIWATLFLMCGKGGKSVTGLPQPWRIVLPALIFNFIYFIISLVASALIQEGTDFFCNELDLSSVNSSSNIKCNELEKLLRNSTSHASLQLNAVVNTSWVTSFAWLVAFVIPLLRIIFASDFRLYKVCVFKIDEAVSNKTEEVVKITDYEEKNLMKHPRHEDEEEEEIEKTVTFPDPLKDVKRSPGVIKKDTKRDESMNTDDITYDDENKHKYGKVFKVKANIENEMGRDEDDDHIVSINDEKKLTSETGNVVKRLKRFKSTDS